MDSWGVVHFRTSVILTLTLRRVTEVRKWTRAGRECLKTAHHRTSHHTSTAHHQKSRYRGINANADITLAFQKQDSYCKSVAAGCF